MTCSFDFVIPVDPIGLLSMVRQIVEQHGGTVTGELPDVSVKFPTVIGELRGDCRLVGDSTVNITVTKKPFLVSCEMARERLANYLSEAVKLYNQQT